MTSRWLVTLGMALSIGCGGGSGNTGGSGGAAQSSTSVGGAGGAGGGTTTTSSTTTTTGSTTTSTLTFDPSGFTCSGATPSLANDIVPTIAVKSCASGMGCHAAMDKPAGFYDQLVNRIAEQCGDIRLMVEPGHPERSYLIHKLVGKNVCTGQTMPKDQPLLPDAEIQIIYDWICSGAPSN